MYFLFIWYIVVVLCCVSFASSSHNLNSSSYSVSVEIKTESKGWYDLGSTYSNFYLDGSLDSATSGQNNGFNIVKFVEEGPNLAAVALG